MKPPADDPTGNVDTCEPIWALTWLIRKNVSLVLGSSVKTGVCATTPTPAGVLARTMLFWKRLDI